MIYLDNAATAPLLPVVKERIKELVDQDFGNAAALHSPGQLARSIIEDARVEVAKLINADPCEIIFTSSGSEANNTVIMHYAGKKMAVSAVEHPSVLEAAKARNEKMLKIIPVDRWGVIKYTRIPLDTKLVSVMLANNELGTIEHIKEIIEYCKQPPKNLKAGEKPPKTFIHTDATQAIGKIVVDVKDLGVDYLSFSAHKIGGPLGVGVLYVKKGAPMTPLIYGGHQENKLRAGTSNVLGIAGLGAAAKYTREQKTWLTYEKKVRPLRDLLRARILEEVPYSSTNTPATGCLPNLLNMSFQAAEGESTQLYLDAMGIVVSTGSACASGDIAPSHVLMATWNDAEVAHSSIRFSLGLNTTKNDIDTVVRQLARIIKQLQSISTVEVGK